MPSLLCQISILGSVLSGKKPRSVKNTTKPRSVKNTTISWFYNFPNCLKSYMLYNRHATRPSLIALKNFILNGNFMKIGRSLSVIRLLRYVPTISTWPTDNVNRQEIARNMHSDSILIIGEKDLLKFIPCICDKA